MIRRHRNDGTAVGQKLPSIKMSRWAAADKVLFEPWFLPPRVSYAILSLVPPAFRTKMRYFFDDYGCMICKKGAKHHSNGMCQPCREHIRKKLVRSIKRRLKARGANRRLDLELFRQEKLAKGLLGRFTPAKSNARVTLDIHRGSNPVYEALCARRE
jgi:hypothetical protein